MGEVSRVNPVKAPSPPPPPPPPPPPLEKKEDTPGKTQADKDRVSGARGDILGSKAPGSKEFSFDAPTANNAIDVDGTAIGNKGKGPDAETAAVQKLLKDKGLYEGKIDGKYGPQTKAAIEKFQKEVNEKLKAEGKPPIKEDGKAGKDTLGHLKGQTATTAPPVDTFQPAEDQAKQNTANANNKNLTPEARTEALAKAGQNIKDMEASGVPKDRVDAAKAELAKATEGVTKDVSEAAAKSAADFKAAAQEAKKLQDANNALVAQGKTPTEAQTKQAQAAADRAKELGKAADSAAQAAQSLSQNPNLSRAQQQQAAAAATQAKAENEASKGVIARTGAPVTQEQKQAVGDAIKAAQDSPDKGKDAGVAAGQKLGEAIKNVNGEIPPGAVGTWMNEAAKTGHEQQALAVGIIKALGPDGLAKLSQQDRDNLKAQIGLTGLGITQFSQDQKAAVAALDRASNPTPAATTVEPDPWASPYAFGA